MGPHKGRGHVKMGEMGVVGPQASKHQGSQSHRTRGGRPAPSPEGISCQAVLDSAFRTVRKLVCCFNPHLWSFVRADLGHWCRQVPSRLLKACLSVGPSSAPKLRPRERGVQAWRPAQGRADPPWKCAG